jgi:hypothetical protein
VEKIYNGFAVGTDGADNEGYHAAQKAEEQLRLDFLSSFQNPQRNAANQTAWDQEEAQLISDSLKYGGDRTLDAAAMYWGETHLQLPVIGPQALLAQVKTMLVSDQPGEREFDEYMANYLAVRFQSLNRLAPYRHSVIDEIDGRGVPLGLAALQAELRIDEVDRTLQAAARLSVKERCNEHRSARHKGARCRSGPIGCSRKRDNRIEVLCAAAHLVDDWPLSSVAVMQQIGSNRGKAEVARRTQIGRS